MLLHFLEVLVPTLLAGWFAQRSPDVQKRYWHVLAFGCAFLAFASIEIGKQLFHPTVIVRVDHLAANRFYIDVSSDGVLEDFSLELPALGGDFLVEESGSIEQRKGVRSEISFPTGKDLRVNSSVVRLFIDGLRPAVPPVMVDLSYTPVECAHILGLAKDAGIGGATAANCNDAAIQDQIMKAHGLDVATVRYRWRDAESEVVRYLDLNSGRFTNRKPRKVYLLGTETGATCAPERYVTKPGQ